MKALIPLDGSSFSREVLHNVKELLDPKVYALTLLRVSPFPNVSMIKPPRPVILDGWSRLMPMYDSVQDAELAKHPIYAMQVWDSFRAELARDLLPDLTTLQELGFTVSVSVRFGNVTEEICRAAKEEPCNLIVMATHGRSGFDRVVIGSNAERVLRCSPVPVLMVRPNGLKMQPPVRTTKHSKQPRKPDSYLNA
jgi:nucleotide-binding universal stress UspA family protein